MGALSLRVFNLCPWSGYQRSAWKGSALFFHACEAVSAAVLCRGSVVGDMADSQIKSRVRVSKRGEVFTANGQKAQKGWDDKASEILFMLGL